LSGIAGAHIDPVEGQGLHLADQGLEFADGPAFIFRVSCALAIRPRPFQVEPDGIQDFRLQKDALAVSPT